MPTNNRLAAVLQETKEREQLAYDHQAHVYRERCRLLAVLSCLFPSHLTPRKNNRREWALCIHSPAGLLTWSLRAHEVPSFRHLERLTEPHWDGATSEVQFSRLDSLIKHLSTK